MKEEQKCSGCLYWENGKCCIMGKKKTDGVCECGFYKEKN